MAEKIMTVNEFFAKLEACEDAITNAKNAKDTLLHRAAEELGKSFELDGSWFMIRTRKSGPYLCSYKEEPGAHLRNRTEANVVKMHDTDEVCVEFEVEVTSDSESLVEDEQYGTPSPTAMVV